MATHFEHVNPHYKNGGLTSFASWISRYLSASAHRLPSLFSLASFRLIAFKKERAGSRMVGRVFKILFSRADLNALLSSGLNSDPIRTSPTRMVASSVGAAFEL